MPRKAAIPDEVRPSQRITVPNLFFAGDWTRTGWPATMESAGRRELTGGLSARVPLAKLSFASVVVNPADLQSNRSNPWAIGHGG